MQKTLQVHDLEKTSIRSEEKTSESVIWGRQALGLRGEFLGVNDLGKTSPRSKGEIFGNTSFRGEGGA